MTDIIDLYDTHYDNVEAEVYRSIRAAAFGEDLGQTSWITAAECDQFCEWLGIDAATRFLEVACGSGGVALRVAERFGATVTGVDVNASAVMASTTRAASRDLASRSTFRVCDADVPLPFADAAFDVIFCNDAINHLRDRAAVLADWQRLLADGGRCLYTDPIIVSGCLSNAEMSARSSIGHFVFTPVGANEQFLEGAGFRVEQSVDLTESVAVTSGRWADARHANESTLRGIEGDRGYEHVQRFLAMVHTLAAERRLSRFAFLAVKA